ncbi:putative MFS family arabinose efflux permease [Tumebacillus sp. BK434]|uniref:MFS transporter n=1 Tax=Tumebacillus sp. BK434 TaxID=2512169 RepID=UPI0010464CC0|nr:MFS transporter [Tumebacillus sp. BK434]TCP55873.1 putative MFS family arabinose efflux permease [Tumebacillus sp. BK434]
MLAFLKGNPRYFCYWMATWLSEFGDWMRNMALLYIVMDLSGNSPFSVSAILFAEFAPIFLIGFFVGVFADRWDRKRTMLGAIGFRVLIMLLFVVAILSESLWMIYIGAFLSTVGSLFYKSPAPAFVMQFVPREDLKTAMSLRQITNSTMMLIGPATGTVVYMTWGGAWALVMTALLMLGSLLLIYVVKVPPSATPATEDSKKGKLRGVMREMRDGFVYSWKNLAVRPLLFTQIFIGLGSGLINVVEIFIITEFLGLPKEMLSLLVTVQGGSMLVGALLVQRMKSAPERLLVYGLLLMGVGLAGMVAYPALWVTMAAILVFSLGNSMLTIGLGTTLQTYVAFEYQGRTGTTVMTLFNGFMVIAMLTAGPLQALFSIVPVVLASGIIVVIGGAVCYYMYRVAHKAGMQPVPPPSQHAQA